MEDLDVDQDTTICSPNKRGNISIEMYTDRAGNHEVWLPFDRLEKWVMEIREETKNNG